ncbi:hypothetical protein NJ7G_4355 [Natrinema sp. J7-2]|nr:hypothetical protein NJ7G_4355 [Natrinema sp. J7-2]
MGAPFLLLPRFRSTAWPTAARARQTESAALRADFDSVAAITDIPDR